MSETAKILIVDDLPRNRRLYGLVVADAGAEAVEASSGEEAIALAAEHDFAMILLDASLPGLDGFATAERLRALPRSADTPLVFVSAVFTKHLDRMRGFASGAVDYLTVPVLPAVLRAKVRVFTRQYELLRQCAQLGRRFEEQNRELRFTNEELKSFCRAAAHDLRTPLRAINGYAAVVQKECAASLGETGRAHLQRIAAAAARMGLIIDDLLALSHVTHAPLQRAAVDLGAMAREVLAELQAAEPTRQVRCAITAGLTARADPSLLRLVLANLLGNAWKYTARSAEPRIEFALAEGEPETTFVLRDNGVGFDASQAKDKLFKPFERFHGPDEFPGTGMGLAIVHRVVTRHGGRMRAESLKGQGAAFFFTLGNGEA